MYYMFDVNLININARVGFAVNKVARGQVYFPVLRFSCVAVTSAFHDHSSAHHRRCVIVVSSIVVK